MSQKKCHIVFRCDGNSQIGLGHVVRSLALAECVQDDFDISFLLAQDSDVGMIPSKFKATQVPKNSLLVQEIDFIHKTFDRQNTIVVLDGYQFDRNYVERLSDEFKTVYIDDIHAFKIAADLVINHTGGLYHEIPTWPYTRKCIGPEYAILRKPFLVPNKSASRKYDVLVCFGGADPQNKTLEILTHLPEEKIKAVILGSAYSFKNQLLDSNIANLSIFENLNAEQMAEIMSSSEVAVLSSSTVAYEFLSCSNGSLYILQTADNQKHLHSFLVQSNAAKSFEGETSAYSVEKRLIDGLSPVRLKKEFLYLRTELLLHIRKAESKDAQLVYTWINDPLVRSQSYNSNSVPWENHHRWFQQKIVDANAEYFIVERKGVSVGQIRFELMKGQALISYLVAADFRGQGIGSIIIKLGVRELIKSRKEVSEIRGYVKINNTASRHSFIRCNFIEHETTDHPDSVLYRLSI